MLELKIIGDKALIESKKRIVRELPGKAFQTMRKAVLLLQRTVMKEKLTGQVLRVRTGRLRSSITARANREGGDIVGKVGTNVVYGKFWEKGGVIRAHTIRPVKKKVLRFEIRGKTVFSMFAEIPSRRVKARPFLAPALKDKTEIIMEMFEKTVEGVMRRGIN